MRIMTLPCHGIGPAATLEVVEAANKRIDLGRTSTGRSLASSHRRNTPSRSATSCLGAPVYDFDGINLGTQSHMDYPPVAEGGRNVSAGFRIGLDLYGLGRRLCARRSSCSWRQAC